jgi:hypothetical protein
MIVPRFAKVGPGQEGTRVATYTRTVVCEKGHRILLLFEWDPYTTTGGPQKYSEPCPVSGCDQRVVGVLPIGADPTSLKLDLH